MLLNKEDLKRLKAQVKKALDKYEIDTKQVKHVEITQSQLNSTTIFTYVLAIRNNLDAEHYTFINKELYSVSSTNEIILFSIKRMENLFQK